MDLESWRNGKKFNETGTVSEGQTWGRWEDRFCLVRKCPVGWAVMNVDLILRGVGRQGRETK